jgi:ubiquitin carboxyl-terminal hydrolase 10
MQQDEIGSCLGTIIKRALADDAKTHRSVIPRGLVNNGNTCFLNSVLQALIACSPFYGFLRQLNGVPIPESMPMLTRFTKFVDEFVEREEELSDFSLQDHGEPFTPVLFQPCIQELFGSGASGQAAPSVIPTQAEVRAGGSSTQEDAQEFLSFALDTLHEELLAAARSANGGTESNFKSTNGSADDGSEWNDVARSKRCVMQKKSDFSSSPITSIFGGVFRCSLKKQASPISVTFEPFHCIPLDIKPQKLGSIEEALELFFKAEPIEDLTCEKTGRALTASKHTCLETLPRVMLLHLKRFGYSAAGSVKIHKAVEFSETLSLRPEWLGGKGAHAAPKMLEYRLFALVSHHGKTVGHGHYTCCVNSGRSNTQEPSWLLIDDHNMAEISVKDVLAQPAYLLFYQQVSPPQVR